VLSFDGGPRPYIEHENELCETKLMTAFMAHGPEPPPTPNFSQSPIISFTIYLTKISLSI